MKKDCLIIVIVFCVLIWITRLMMARTGLLFGNNIKNLITFDIVMSIITVIVLMKFFSTRFLNVREKRMVKLLYVFIIIFGMFFELTVSLFRKFDNALEMCRYQAVCIKGTINYNTGNEYVFIRKDGVYNYVLKDKYWHTDLKKYQEIYDYKDNEYRIKVYPYYDKYFILVNLGENGNIIDLKDDIDSEFKTLEMNVTSGYKINGYYGKIISNFNDYKIKINGKDVEFQKVSFN